MRTSNPLRQLMVTSALLVFVWLTGSSILTQAQRPTADDQLAAEPEMGFAEAGANLELSPGYTQTASAGSVVTFTHVLTNTGDAPDTFIVQSASSQGWPVALIGGAYPMGTLYLPLSLDAGMTATFQVRLTVPAGSTVLVGVVDRTFVTATSQVSPTLWVSTTDTTLVPPSGGRIVFLPLIANSIMPVTKLGVDFGFLTSYTDVLTYDLPLAKQMGADWMRVELPWIQIEKTPGQYDWAPYDTLFARMREVGFKPLPIVYGAPSWAAEHSCGPISDTVALENFLQAALTRYGSSVDAWEFTNEPEGRVPYASWGPIRGCWGLEPAQYASQLGIFYNQVKKLDPGALVLLGGLAYDNWAVFERSFFSKTLQSGAGQFFDVVSLHYYPINPEFPTMAHKIKEIQDTMLKNRVYGKGIWVTETGMWVNNIGVEGLNGSVELQRDFIVRELTRGIGAGVDNMFWFGLREHSVPPGAVHRWLISLNHEPINGYNTLRHFASKIEGASFTSIYRDVPSGVEAYRFTAPDRSLYILWSNTITQTVKIPASTNAILTSRDGDLSRVIAVQNGQVTFQVDTKPVFLEILG